MSRRRMRWMADPEHLICRDLQHAWKPQTASKVKGGFVRTLVCTRCDTVKKQHLDRYGYITSTSMIYPQGYIRPGQGRMTKADRADLRLGNLNA